MEITNLDPLVQRSLRAQFRISFPYLIAGAIAIAGAICSVTSSGQELTSEPTSLLDWQIVTGISVGIICLFVAGKATPRTWKTVSSAIIGSLICGVLCWALSSVIIDRVRQGVTFRYNLTERLGQFPISMTSITRYNGDNYNVLLRDYPVMLSVDKQDYISAFGRKERSYPHDYCVYAIVQSSGSDSRIIVQHGLDLPAGSLKRCVQGKPV